MELQIRNLSKTYANGVHALKDVTLTIPRGMFGLLGPNGAGKSTLMRTIATLQEPNEGSIRLGDIDALRQKERVRETLGYLPQEFGVYPKVRAERLLERFAVLKGITERRARREVVTELSSRAMTGSPPWAIDFSVGTGRLGQAKDLYHTVKSHSVAKSGTNSGCSISKDSVACGLYPILEYHFFRNSLLG
jgi:ABC-type uncharacterized transport system ATPase subunit